MPGLKKLEQIRNQLTALGKEPEVTAEWGETFEEFPLPTETASAPDLDVDSLLSGLGGPESSLDANLGDISASDAADSAAGDDLDALLAGLSAPADVTASEPEIPTFDNASFGDGLDSLVASDGSPATGASFDDLLSSLPLEDLGADTGDNRSAETPSPESAAAEEHFPEIDLPVMDGLDADNFALPDDLLSGFAADIESARAENADGAADDFSVPSSEPDLSAADIPASPEGLAPLEEIPEAETLSDFEIPEPSGGSVPDSAFPEIPGLEDIPSVDALSESDFPEDAPSASIPEAEGFSLENFADPAAGLGAGDLGGFELPGDFGASFPEGDLTPPDIESPPVPNETPNEEIAELSPEVDENTADGVEDLAAMDFTPDFEEGPAIHSQSDVPEMTFPDQSPSTLDSLDFPSPPEFSGDSPASEGDSFSMPDLASLGDFGFGSGTSTPAGGAAPSDEAGSDFSDFEIPDDLNVSSGGDSAAEVLEPAVPDGFDGFSLDEDFLKTSIESAGAPDDVFQIPGFSDFTSGPARASVSDLPPLAGVSKKSAKKELPREISEEDFRRFLEELAGFPLNLRIATEEFLSGDAGTDTQKLELVHGILGGESPRKIARTLETSLGRTIAIPKDFEKKNLEELEREKASLKYVIRNRILPLVFLFTVVATLAACVVYLSWQFIYRPLAAESLYQRGYAAIEDARYTQALSLFDEAVAVKEKKKWYFRYARAFRDKKQYLTAEQMYERILARFKDDKTAGLEYAEMLRTDLRNFEKAETVIRRRILDNYVNDPDGLLLLGDVYLDWAEEDPSKFEEARKSYAQLIELYGEQDVYLSRMMRFFIRTDNLKEVLPLKDHFMSKRAKIGASDLVELSGYLLKKRYEPAPGDSEFLRDKIEDVRTLLARAVAADDSSPEAHYNMARFFIYNYKNDLAKTSLSEALKRFDDAHSMSPRRVVAHVDAYRLLGELLAGDLEYLKARDLYAKGLSVYEDARANRSVGQSPLVGRLYADYADIDYFISGDLATARLNYEKSAAEMNDTPSIRYRLGYIDYQNADYPAAMRNFLLCYADTQDDRNLLYGYANTLFRKGDYFAAQGYYERLQEELDAERIRKGVMLPQIRADHGEFVELYMHAANNLGVALERVAERTGDSKKRSRALALLSESNRAWDALTRNPETMIRAQGSNLAYLNIQDMVAPRAEFKPEIYQDIPKTLENEKVLQQRVDQ